MNRDVPEIRSTFAEPAVAPRESRGWPSCFHSPAAERPLLGVREGLPGLAEERDPERHGPGVADVHEGDVRAHRGVLLEAVDPGRAVRGLGERSGPGRRRRTSPAREVDPVEVRAPATRTSGDVPAGAFTRSDPATFAPPAGIARPPARRKAIASGRMRCSPAASVSGTEPEPPPKLRGGAVGERQGERDRAEVRERQLRRRSGSCRAPSRRGRPGSSGPPDPAAPGTSGGTKEPSDVPASFRTP